MNNVSYTSTEVKTAWKQRNYKRYEVNFRLDTDKEIISQQRTLRDDGNFPGSNGNAD